MAEFEELRLTVNLVDNASAGLARIRTEIGQLTQTAGQMVTSFTQAGQSIAGVSSAAQSAAPALRSAGTEMTGLSRSATDTGRALGGMLSVMQQGVGGLPRLAMGAYDASRGLSGMSESLNALAPGAGRAAIAIGGVAIGVVAVGAAVVAYGVSVFKFAREMEQLSRTAKAMGASFAEVKLATDHARQYGLSAEAAIQNMAGLQKAQTDLAQNGSKLRQELLGKGLDPNWLNQISRETEAWRAQNMVQEKGIQIRKELEAKGWTKMAARGMANQFAQSFGQDPGLYDRPSRVAPTEKEVADLKRVEQHSAEIDKIWGDISSKVRSMSFEFLAAGLPRLKGELDEVNAIFIKMDKWLEIIKNKFSGLGDYVPEWLKSVFRGVMNGPGGDPAATFSDRFDALKTPSSARAANDNNPLFQRTSFATEENTTETQKLTSQIEKLNAYFDRATGGAGGGGGGFQNAAYHPDGGGGGGGAANSFGNSTYRNLGTNYGGGGGGGGAAETSSAAVTGAQGGSDLDKSAFDSMFKGTPLEGKYDKVVEAAKANNVPPSLMAGIIAHETGKGTSAMLRNKNNPAGLMDPKTGMATGQSFGSVDQGIEAAGRTIGKNYARGGNTIAGMAGIYAPVGAANDPGGLNRSWTSGVTNYTGQLAAPGGGTPSATPGTPGAAVDVAMTQLGLNEHKDRRDIQQYLRTGGAGMDPERVAWCAAFVNSSLGQAGIKGTGSAAAASFYKWGQAASGGVQKGDVLVKPHHVGMATGKVDESGRIQMLSGNTSDRVGLTWENPNNVTARRAFPPDRTALSKTTDVNATGKLSVDVNAPPNTKVEASGGGLFKNTELQRSTQMPHTDHGPSAAATANQFMASR